MRNRQNLKFFARADRELTRFMDSFCLIDIEIEQYKLFIDWYGQKTSRELTDGIEEMLISEAERSNGMACYLGLNHFCIIIPYDEEHIAELYKKTQELISSFSNISGFLPAFGVAMIDGSCELMLDYFNHAVLSCEKVKGSYHNHIDVYDVTFHEKSAEEYRLLYEFQNALDDGEICFWLQPQYRVSKKKIVGAEALARWQKPDGSFVSPGLFVPILEKHGLVTKLDTFIWEEVCKWIHKRLSENKALIPVSVNLSRADIVAMDVPALFDKLIKKYELPTNCLKIEITESAYVDNAGSVGDTVSKLQTNGFMVLMDDFGSGYSSLNMLNSINVDLIKLDAQFLRSYKKEEKKGINILESVVNMTQNLAMPIIVEGVETDEQAKFLSDLGCRYAQGYFFSRPMSVPDFDKLVADESIIDTGGFKFKANQQIHVREFLDDNIYSDAMLNNILGPVAFYNWSGNNVDIVRFNDQYFHMLEIEVDEFEKRRHHLQKELYPGDVSKFYELLESAYKHHTTGASGILRFYKPNGVLIWISLKIYFLSEDVQGKKFYTSAQDVTELQFVSSNIPGAYFRCANDKDFTILFISENFQKMTGFNEEEIKRDFKNKLALMIHPDDLDRVRDEAIAVSHSRISELSPYRIRRKLGSYIYIAEQAHLTDQFGLPCWQCMTIDVTDVMKMRNQMHILSECLNDTILFLRRTRNGLIYETVVHGFSKELMLDGDALASALNAGTFCKWIDGYDDIPHQQYTEMFINSIIGTSKELKITLPSGRRIKAAVRADKVPDNRGGVEYIVVMRKAK